MILILATIVFFVLVGGTIYLLTEFIPKRRFLKRHKVHKNAFKQFDITGEQDDIG